jgi:hypothetical protein
MMEQQSNNGGRRRGRPANDRNVMVSVRLSKEAVDKLNRLTNNKAAFIESLILNYKEQ